MRAIREHLDQELVWVQLRLFEGQYELRIAQEQGEEPGEPLAVLRRHGPTGADGTVAEGTYHVQQQGILRPTAVITQGETPVAALSSVIDGAILTFANGRPEHYVWTKAHLLGYMWQWVDGAGQWVLSAQGMVRDSSVRLHLEPRAGQIAEIGLLALLAEYLVLEAWRTAIIAAG
jgi:hypothetical protein